MDKLEHYHEFAKNTVAINWCILNICNYKCSYCPDFLHSGSSGRPDLDKVSEFCTNIIEHYEEKNVHFEFTGGEVTLWREFPDLVLFLKSHKNVYVGVISNGSSKLKWWDDMKKHLDHACLSFQPEFSKRDHYVALT
jgi:MoaA/NifB/PqqE/SkfB family radical SAM enzyme